MGFVANLDRLYTMTFDIYCSRKQIPVCVSPKFPDKRGGRGGQRSQLRAGEAQEV